MGGNSIGAGVLLVGAGIAVLAMADVSGTPSPAPEPTPTPAPDRPPDDGYRADFNQDGVVNQADIDLFMSHYGTSQGDAGYSVGFDFNHDGHINSQDYAMLSDFVAHWNYYHPDSALTTHITPLQWNIKYYGRTRFEL